MARMASSCSATARVTRAGPSRSNGSPRGCAAPLPAAHVSLAFLELMTPSLGDAVAEQVAAGCTHITVVPVFFGQGGHVRRDLPQLVDACRAVHPGVEIRCATAVGEDDGVLDAIARYCIDQIGDDA